MEVQTLTTFLGWCTLINLVLMTVMFLICVLGANRVYRLHSRWFPLKRETFNAMLYGFLGLYKLLVFFFNVVPYVALRLAT
jgi:hypothetical protein